MTPAGFLFAGKRQWPEMLAAQDAAAAATGKAGRQAAAGRRVAAEGQLPLQAGLLEQLGVVQAGADPVLALAVVHQQEKLAGGFQVPGFAVEPDQEVEFADDVALPVDQPVGGGETDVRCLGEPEGQQGFGQPAQPVGGLGGQPVQQRCRGFEAFIIDRENVVARRCEIGARLDRKRASPISDMTRVRAC